MLIHPSDYNIAIRKDGKLFRIAKYIDYDQLSIDEFCIISPDKKCNDVPKYFDVFGKIREQYWILNRIIY